MERNITEFSTFGSCSSRNIFNSKINKDYKKYFKINKSVEASTLISLMSTPIEVDEKLLKSNNKYDTICVKDDLSKDFLNFIKKDYVDYIILDTFLMYLPILLSTEKINSYLYLKELIELSYIIQFPI